MKAARKILIFLSWFGAGFGLLLTLGFIEKNHDLRELKDISIRVNSSEGNFFIAENDVLDIVHSMGYYPVSSKLQEVNVQLVETLLDENPVIEDSDVYLSVDGDLNIDIEQRRPILRIFSATGDSYYMDEHGHLMPLSFNYSAKVPVVNGAISLPYEQLKEGVYANTPADTLPKAVLLSRLFEIAKAIDQDEFWKAQFEQVYYNQDREFELIPQVGNHRILIGDGTQIHQKLDKLWVFYNEGLEKTGWNEYSEINLKFKDQVVCTKLN